MPKDALLFVNPYIEDFAAYDHFMKPYGLLLLAAQFRESHEIMFLDALAHKDRGAQGADISGTRERYTAPFVSEKISKPNIFADVPRAYRRYGITEDAFVAKARALNKPPKYIFVTSGMTYWYGGVRHTIALLKEIFSDAKIILGGNYACLLPEHARMTAGADHVIAKKNLTEVVREVCAYIGAPMREVPCTYLPAWEVLEDQACLPVLTSFGCPYSCSYCAGYRLEPCRALDQDAALRLFTHARERYGTRAFAFYDDALLVDAGRHALPLFKELARACPDSKLFTPNGLHARMITRELAEAMRACGFADVRLALESSDAAYMQTSGAKSSQEDFVRAAEHLFAAGFTPGMIKAYCLAGAPVNAQGGGPELFMRAESVHATLEFARRQQVVPMIAWYSPVPGSRDFAALTERYALSDPLTHNNTAWMYTVNPGREAYQELKHHELEARRAVTR
jgi:hypothetical protein